MTTENTESTRPVETPRAAPPAPAPAEVRRPVGPRPGGSYGQGPPRDSRSGPRGPRRGRGRFFTRRRVCTFCVDHVTHIDYKDMSPLRRYVSDLFKIEGRRKTGTCAKHQRALANAIKRARHLALIPFSRIGALDQRFPG